MALGQENHDVNMRMEQNAVLVPQAVTLDNPADDVRIIDFMVLVRDRRHPHQVLTQERLRPELLVRLADMILHRAPDTFGQFMPGRTTSSPITTSKRRAVERSRSRLVRSSCSIENENKIVPLSEFEKNVGQKARKT
jgi:hypothetical protein